MTADEKDQVCELIAAWTAPLDDDAADMDIAAWNYQSDQAVDELPWRNDPDRADELVGIAERAIRFGVRP